MSKLTASIFRARICGSYGQQILGISVFALSLSLAGNLNQHDSISRVNSPISDPIISAVNNIPVQSGAVLLEKDTLADIRPPSIPIVYPRVKPQQSIKMASYALPKTARINTPSQTLKRRTAPPVRPSIPQQRSLYQSPDTRKSGPHLSGRKLFGSVEIQFEDEKKIRSWANSYAPFVRDTEALRTCVDRAENCQNLDLGNWAAELRSINGSSRLATMNAVNARVNRRLYVTDSANYARSDYWASPTEFLQKSGDCEDFALMKFASLLALGFDNKDMRLVVGTLADGKPHAILTVSIGSTEYVLDNQRAAALSVNINTGYTPKYSMNLTNRWSHVMPKTSTI